MALPRSIQAQVEQAEATLAAYAAPVEAQSAAPEPLEVMANPSVEPIPAPAPPPAAPPPTPSEETWEHKFRSLQGLFNKNMPELQGQVKNLTQRLDQALGALESQRAAPQEPKESASTTADPKDVENFGADLVDMVNRIAERRFDSVAQQVEAKLSALQQMLSTVEQRLEGTSQSVAVSAEQSFFDNLTKQVPDWETVNANPAFLAWLADSDPVYGVPRQRALDSAREQLDVARIVSVFRAFAPVTPNPTPVARNPVTPNPTPVARNPVDRQVSPKAGASNAPPTATPKATFTQKQVSDFYNDVSRGKFRGREAEAAAIEQSVNLAISEGRIQ